MIDFKPIDESNFQQIIDIKMPEGHHFVAPNIYSLAQAWVHRDIAHPFAIYNDDGELVGFIMLNIEKESREAGIWRLMIALEHQSKGYGTDAVARAVDYVKSLDGFDEMCLRTEPENQVAIHVYRKFGFEETGEMDGNETIMRLRL